MFCHGGRPFRPPTGKAIDSRISGTQTNLANLGGTLAARSPMRYRGERECFHTTEEQEEEHGERPRTGYAELHCLPKKPQTDETGDQPEPNSRPTLARRHGVSA